MQTWCIVKGEAQKSPLFWRFSGGFWFSQDRLFSRNSTRNPLNFKKSPIFTNAPCKTACLYNAPSMHTADFLGKMTWIRRKGRCWYESPPDRYVPSVSPTIFLLFIKLLVFEGKLWNSSGKLWEIPRGLCPAQKTWQYLLPCKWPWHENFPLKIFLSCSL